VLRNRKVNTHKLKNFRCKTFRGYICTKLWERRYYFCSIRWLYQCDHRKYGVFCTQISDLLDAIKDKISSFQLQCFLIWHFLGAFEKQFRKPVISFFMYFRFSTWNSSNPTIQFRWKSLSDVFIKFVDLSQLWLKMG